ncbi:GM19482 [Drosophila sechellia]|uniref:GM19482 n=1 Tax=Drosophila sechellia TaxID=7238 RepID=B4I9U3_DROSE|nr:GM19482 [Drosophila sechellia]
MGVATKIFRSHVQGSKNAKATATSRSATRRPRAVRYSEDCLCGMAQMS